MSNNFLFDSLNSKTPNSSRKIQIRRLYDVLQVCLQRRDVDRAKRAWAILVRCPEVDWKAMWTTALSVLVVDGPSSDHSGTRIEFLREMMLLRPHERREILAELTALLMLGDRTRDALDLLELHLTSLQYQDDPVLHTYAGLAAMYLAQPSPDEAKGKFNLGMLRSARSYFERAKSLNPDDQVATLFIQKVDNLSAGDIPRKQLEPDSDEDTNTAELEEPSFKRKRTTKT